MLCQCFGGGLDVFFGAATRAASLAHLLLQHKKLRWLMTVDAYEEKVELSAHRLKQMDSDGQTHSLR